VRSDKQQGSYEWARVQILLRLTTSRAVSNPRELLSSFMQGRACRSSASMAMERRRTFFGSDQPEVNKGLLYLASLRLPSFVRSDSDLGDAVRASPTATPT